MTVIIRNVLTGTAVLALLGSLSACGAGSAEDSEPTAAPKTVTTTVEAPDESTKESAEESAKDSVAKSESEKPKPAAADTGGRSKADYPYYVADRLGTAPVPGGSGNTSPQFARAVYEAFIDHWVRTGDKQPVLNVASPVTGQTYAMTCTAAARSHVECAGGNNAKVYILAPLDPTVTPPMGLQQG